MSKSIVIKITTTPQVRQHLQSLLPLGLYGNSISEAAERLICEALKNDLKRTKQALLTAKMETQE